MSEWIDLTVYALQIVAVWGWFSTWIARAAVLVVADRNQDWLAAHPDVERRLAGNRWFLRSCWLWGSLSLVTLCAFQVGLWPRSLAVLRETPPWETLKDLNSVLFIAGLIYVGGCSLLFSRWVGREVPLAQRRQATLEPRSIHDHIPRAFQYATYSIIVLHLTAWVAVGVAGRYATGAFWGGLAFQVAISAVFLWIVASAVRRRPVAVDRIFGPRHRQTEVRLAFAAQLLPLMNGTARLYEQAADTPLPQIDRILHLGLVLFVVAMVIMLAVRFQKNHASGQTRWPGAPRVSRRRGGSRAKKILLGVVASVAFLIVLAVSAGLWWARSLYHSEHASPEQASAAFADVRERFVGIPPAFEIRGNRLVVLRSAGTSALPATAAHVLVWMPAQQTLSRVRLPFDVSIVATEPLPLEALAGVGSQGIGSLMDARRRGDELNVRIADLERHGRTLLLDGITSDGKHVLMWNE